MNVPDEAIESAVDVAHEGPLNLCDTGSDTCETWPEVRKLLEAAAPAICEQAILAALEAMWQHWDGDSFAAQHHYDSLREFLLTELREGRL